LKSFEKIIKNLIKKNLMLFFGGPYAYEVSFSFLFFFYCFGLDCNAMPLVGNLDDELILACFEFALTNGTLSQGGLFLVLCYEISSFVFTQKKYIKNLPLHMP